MTGSALWSLGFGAFVWLVWPAVGLAQEMPEAPPGGQPLFDDVVAALSVGQEERGEAQRVEVDGPGFSRAVRVSSNRRGSAWDMQSLAGVSKPLARGEAILVRFWARTIQTQDESEQGFLWVSLGENQPPWTKSLESTVPVQKSWQPFALRARVRRDYGAGQLSFAFGVGDTVQMIEIGGVELLHYAGAVAVGDLPQTRTTYAGREPDAPWRKAADERIRAIRMAPFSVRVLDADGTPVRGARVHVQMKRHRFQFGAAVTAWQIADQTDPANAIYRQRVAELFNAGSFANILKWPPWEGDWGDHFDRAVAMRALSWMKEQGLSFRAHVLIWPSWRNLPSSLRRYQDNPDADALRRLSLAHIDDITQATRGFVSEWDVVNEPYDNHDLMDICGRDIMVEWFKRARQNLPDAGLALNDYGILAALTPGPHQDHYEETIRYLLEQGAPLTVLGMQGHFGGAVPSPERMLATLDRYAKFGLPIRITEFTVGTDDEQLHADFMRDAMTVVFSHPSVVGFQFWGLGQLFGDDMTPRPSYAVYRELVFGRWWTDEEGTTDENGAFSSSGFMGSYEVSAVAGDRTASGSFELVKGAEPLTLTLHE